MREKAVSTFPRNMPPSNALTTDKFTQLLILSSNVSAFCVLKNP